MDIHQRIRLELREVWAVWRRELARFDGAGLSAAERTARIEQLQRRSLAVLAGTANGIEASGSVTDEIAELTKLRAESVYGSCSGSQRWVSSSRQASATAGASSGR